MKKAIKKLMAALLAVAMLCAMAVPALAAGTGSITIENAVNGETYTAYKMFDVTTSTTSDGKTAYSYTVVDAWKNFFEKGAGKDYITLNTYGQPSWNEGKSSEYGSADLEAFAKAALAYATENSISGKSADAADGKATISGLDLGYYVVDTSVGSLCSLNTVEGLNTKIDEKNDVPSIDKTVDGKASNTAGIGKVLNYVVTIHAKKGATGYVLTDTMTKGLTFNKDSLKVTVDGASIGSGNYTMPEPTKAADGSTTFTVTFKQDYLDTLTSDTDILVSYTATVNKDAEIVDGKNINNAQLKYGNKATVEKQTTTLTYKFDLVKTDAQGNLLTGAKFKLYSSENADTAIKLVKVGDNYRVAEEGESNTVDEIEITKKNAVTISGLDKADYWLEETVAPDGYNKLTERKKVELSSDEFVATATIENAGTDNASWTSGGVKVVNNAGATLPSTGGMGTTIFYVVGGGLMIAAVVLLVTKKRMENK